MISICFLNTTYLCSCVNRAVYQYFNFSEQRVYGMTNAETSISE